MKSAITGVGASNKLELAKTIVNIILQYRKNWWFTQLGFHDKNLCFVYLVDSMFWLKFNKWLKW